MFKEHGAGGVIDSLAYSLARKIDLTGSVFCWEGRHDCSDGDPHIENPNQLRIKIRKAGATKNFVSEHLVKKQ